MAGVFTPSFYDASYSAAQVHPCKVQPETLTASVGAASPVTNKSAATAATNPISAQVGKGRRTLGLHTRHVSLKLSGTAPAGYASLSVTKIPAMTPAFYNACTKGTTVTYLGTTWLVSGTSSEVVR